MTTLTLNYRWRSLIAAALEGYYRDYFDTEDELDNQDSFCDFLEDLYNFEEPQTMEAKNHAIQLVSSQNTGSTSYTTIAAASFSYTTSKPNLLVKVTALVVNGGNNDTFIRPLLDSTAGLDGTENVNFGTNGRVISCVDRWENVSPGSHNFNFQMKVSGGTGTINNAVKVIWEIIEYD